MAAEYTRRNGVLVPLATVPGPQGTIGTQGPQGVQGDLFTTTSVNGVTGSRTLTGALLSTTQLWNLSGNTTLTSIGAPSTGTLSGTMTLQIKQPASGGPFTMAWPATLEWVNDAAGPPMPTPANAELMIQLLWNGYAWRAIVVGPFFP